MDVGVQMVFQNWHDGLTDEQMFLPRFDLGERADALGYDAVWIVEHHFADYAMCPDDAVALAYLAGRTQQIRLGTGAVILPWNDPLRVAEKIVLLDTIAGERGHLRHGPRAGRIEYNGFRYDMDEARERFDESAAMILAALETGVIDGDGPFYPQPRVEIRPQPPRSFRDRVYSVAGSPDSGASAAQLGAGLLVFLVSGYDFHADAANRYRALFEEHHHRARAARGVHRVPLRPRGRGGGRAHGARVHRPLLRVGDPALRLRGRPLPRHQGLRVLRGERPGHPRPRHAARAGRLRRASAVGHARPGASRRSVEQQRELGDMHLSVGVSYAGMPFETVHANIELFAEKVLPAVHRL